MIKSAPLLIAVSLLVSSCGPPLAWSRPQTDAADQASDQATCQKLAWQEAVRLENDLWFNSRMTMGGFALRRGFYPSMNYDRYSWEDRFFSTCMQAKGYRLLPRPTQGG